MSKREQKITVINKITGEVFDLEYSDIEEAEQAYLVVKGMLDALDRAKKKLLEYIGLQVESKCDFSDGLTGQWVQGRRKKYRIETVRKYLDEDQLALVSEINGGELKKLFAQLVEDGHGIPGAWEDIEANADVTATKAYFVIKRS